MSVLRASWSAFEREIADIYLDGFGHPSPAGKQLVASLLREMFGDRPFSLADFGCGNGHLYGFFKAQGLACHYTGYDFSDVLLAAGRDKYPDDDNVRFIEADIQDPEMPGERCDIVLFSHVLEMLASPERSLLAAKRLAPKVMIRFFEPPAERHDLTELLMMNNGSPNQVPYLRRSMSQGYYEYILTKAECSRIDIHQVNGNKEEVHILHFS